MNRQTEISEWGQSPFVDFSMDRSQLAGMGMHYKFRTLDYFLEAQQELGLETIEMWCARPHILLDDYEYDDGKALREKAESYGLRVGAFSPECTVYNYNLCAHEETAARHSMGYFENGIRAASEVGAPVMVINCCGGARNEEPEEDGLKRAIEMHQRLAEVAASCGVTLVAESLRPQESRIGARIDQMKRIFDGVNHPNFKVMIDLTAMSVAGETIQQWFDVFGKENIAHAHFQDCNPYGHYIWGEGSRNLRNDLEEMIKNGYEGYFTQELTDPAYYFDPFTYDKRNVQNLKMYMQD